MPIDNSINMCFSVFLLLLLMCLSLNMYQQSFYYYILFLHFFPFFHSFFTNFHCLTQYAIRKKCVCNSFFVNILLLSTLKFFFQHTHNTGVENIVSWCCRASCLVVCLLKIKCVEKNVLRLTVCANGGRTPSERKSEKEKVEKKIRFD